MHRRLFSLAALGLAAGCTPLGNPSTESVRLPPGAIQGAGDPVRGAVSQAAYVFGNPRSFVNRPADMAQAVANLEFLTVAVPQDPRFMQQGGNLPMQLAQARAQTRQVFGIAPDADPQFVINRLYAFSAATQAGDRMTAANALSAPGFPNGAATAAALAQSPRVPEANIALNRVQQEVFFQEREPRL